MRAIIIGFLSDASRKIRYNFHMPDFPDIERESDVMTESETKLEKPKMFKVILHNDDFTTMEFVVFVLEYVFGRSTAEAFIIMLKVHNEGIGIAGVYPYEVANMKAEKAINLAKAREYPFLCTVEEE
ncbi:MAG TPA: ATP-dependent Clp protease adaptor ClpS [Nitrosospira sp.]|nr:ATP-dependent Clp protease adaptor ClpS [Nitrosospira sp.]